MEAVRIVQGTAVPLARSDVDTDQIIPSDWLKRVERTGFEKGLFSEWRDDPNFVMNDERFRLISVTHYVTNAFPPVFISCGNGDPLTPQAEALARKLKNLGVKVDSLFFPTDYNPPLPHEYQFNLDTPAGQKALDRMLSFVSAIVQRKN